MIFSPLIEKRFENTNADERRSDKRRGLKGSLFRILIRNESGTCSCPFFEQKGGKQEGMGKWREGATEINL